MTADHDPSRAKLNLQLSQNNVLLYGCSCLSAINDASLLNTTVVVDPNPPVVEKTIEEKEPNSISRMRCSYARFKSYVHAYALYMNMIIGMEYHIQQVPMHCRVCGLRLKKTREKPNTCYHCNRAKNCL